jgi:hypothetical protein
MIKAYESFGASVGQMQEAEKIRYEKIIATSLKTYEDLAMSSTSNFEDAKV